MLKEIESRGIYSNFGPVNSAFESDLIAGMFNGKGFCTTVCNATLGLMVAIRSVIQNLPNNKTRYALMPSFTFAAAAQAAVWCGLTPLFCDIDPDTWAADPESEKRMLRQYKDDIAIVLPYATFGYDIDIGHYENLSRHYNIPVVIDAAASLGTISRNGENFGAGSAIPIIFSMHATKSFATGEGGLIYSADRGLIEKIRLMSNFGFGKPRNATMPGLNAKMSEIGALQGRLRLNGYKRIVERRQYLVSLYRRLLPELEFQPISEGRQAHQFASALLPKALGPERHRITQQLAQSGIGVGAYFSPHLAEQDYFKEICPPAALPVTRDVASRIISMPLYDSMKSQQVREVAAAIRRLVAPEETGLPLRQTAIGAADFGAVHPAVHKPV